MTGGSDLAAVSRERPCLRPVEAIPDPANHRIVVRDPTQLAAGMLVVGPAEFFLLSLLDGERRRVEIQAEFAKRFGHLLLSHQLDGLLEQLEGAGYLSGPGFETYYARRAAEYAALPRRPLRNTDGLGASVPELPAFLDTAVDAAVALAEGLPTVGGLAAIVAPHLDYPRGLSCYGAAYQALRRELAARRPRRVVVLGTNHFGRSRSVVATSKDFETPWGVLATDREFLVRLQEACGGNLMPYELDHLREHSVELHAVWLHHLLGDQVRLVPVLCPDPSREHGTAPGDEGGVDLRVFALALGQLLRKDPEPALLVASADLSHAGAYFGDSLQLTGAALARVREVDETALGFVDRNEPEALRVHMAATANPTRWCSVGCLYTMMTALGPRARAQRLHYHQAVVPELQNAVTCAAFAFYR